MTFSDFMITAIREQGGDYKKKDLEALNWAKILYKKKEKENKHFHTLIINRFVSFKKNKQGAYSEPDNVPGAKG